MWLLWDWMGIDHWEFHGMVLWEMHWESMDLHWGLLIGHSMEVLYGYVIGMSTWDSHGIALLLLHRSSMEVPYVQYLWASPCGFYGIAWGLTIGHSMAWVYGQCTGAPWACIGAAH